MNCLLHVFFFYFSFYPLQQDYCGRGEIIYVWRLLTTGYLEEVKIGNRITEGKIGG